MKIEVRKPQYVANKQQAAAEIRGKVPGKTPAFFRFLLFATYACSVLALWFVFQRVSPAFLKKLF